MTSIPLMAMASCFAAAMFVAQEACGQGTFTYSGMCDASAGASLGSDHFIVANDERNKLRIYKRLRPGYVGALELSPFLDTKEDKESDLEGAAAIGR